MQKLDLANISRKKIVAVFLILVLIGTVIVINIYRNSLEVAISVQSSLVQMQPLGQTVFASGRVELAEKQEVYAFSNKLVEEINVIVGDTVTKGQIVAVLESEQERLSLIEAQAVLAVEQANYDKKIRPNNREKEIAQAEFKQAEIIYLNSKKNYERNERLYSEGVISQQDFENIRREMASAEANYLKAKREHDLFTQGPDSNELRLLQANLEKAKAMVRLAEQNLSRCVIEANMDGIVMSLDIEIGDMVNPGQKLLTIGNPNNLQIKVGIGEGEASLIELGQDVEIEAPALMGISFNGSVIEVAKAAVISQDGQSRQIEVPIKIAVDSETNGLLPGYSVDLRIIIVPKEDRIVIPYEALTTKENLKTVFIIEEGFAKEKEVKIGISGDLYIEVKEGLHEGQKIIINPPLDLEDGKSVKESAFSSLSGEGTKI